MATCASVLGCCSLALAKSFRVCHFARGELAAVFAGLLPLADCAGAMSLRMSLAAAALWPFLRLSPDSRGETADKKQWKARYDDNWVCSLSLQAHGTMLWRCAKRPAASSHYAHHLPLFVRT